ncbi:MAG: hydrogenase expression/synthesis HypA [Acidobacteriaceae bacterium]|jgi:hydrogenase nickel incorporation protein HypA/HybF|nr:hydrogenase expression/synthesis HypA [Acidobacteriaceae bacterium]
MHELSIALSMIEGVLEESEKRGGMKVEAVHLRLGVFSGVDQQALDFSYGLACEGTQLEGSQLVIEKVPLLIYCPFCATERAAQSEQQLCCSICSTPAASIVQGQELEITALEIAA